MNIDDVQKKLAYIIENAPKVYESEAVAVIDLQAIEKDYDTRFAVIAFKHDDGKTAKNRLDMLVHVDPEWQEYIADLHLARVKHIKAKANVKALETQLDACRSLNKNYQVT